MDIFMEQGITRRSLAKRFLLVGSALTFFGIQNNKLTNSPSIKIQHIGGDFVSINGWIVSKDELSSKGKRNHAS
jgi:hypothetical protein